MKRKFKHGDRVMQTYPQPEPGEVVEIAGQLFFRSDVDKFTVLIGNDDYYKLDNSNGRKPNNANAQTATR